MPDMKMADLIFENPSLLLMMEHFGIDNVVQDKRISEICNENNLNRDLFVIIANLYNGFSPSSIDKMDSSGIESVISFLKTSHRYYLNDKIPEIQELIKDLFALNNIIEIKLIEKFFIEYSNEVKEHLNYEDLTAFPYFHNLLCGSETSELCKEHFSSQVYKDHHTDIESKLADLKTLLVKHISLKNSPQIKRQLLLGLFELEQDLNIHSAIEELVLIPLIKRIEKSRSN